MYIANMDIKTAFDVARPKNSAKVFGGQISPRMAYSGPVTSHEGTEAHGWIATVSITHATFENIESRFNVSRCIRHGSVEAPTLGLKLAKQIFWNGVHIHESQGGSHQMSVFCRSTTDGFHMSHLGADDEGVL